MRLKLPCSALTHASTSRGRAAKRSLRKPFHVVTHSHSLLSSNRQYRSADANTWRRAPGPMAPCASKDGDARHSGRLRMGSGGGRVLAWAPTPAAAVRLGPRRPAHWQAGTCDAGWSRLQGTSPREASSGARLAGGVKRRPGGLVARARPVPRRGTSDCLRHARGLNISFFSSACIASRAQPACPSERAIETFIAKPPGAHSRNHNTTQLT